MDETPIALPESIEPAQVAAIIDAVLAEAGLQVTMRDTLRQYPGCIHWHLKRSRGSRDEAKPLRGTLELTFWPNASRAWFSVHRNRTAAWIAPTIKTLQAQLQRRFAEL